MKRLIYLLLFLLFFTSTTVKSQISWISPITNDINNLYFYNGNGGNICGSNTVITCRSFNSLLDGTYYCNYQIHSNSGQLIKDTSFNSNQLSGVTFEKCLSYNLGYILALRYSGGTFFDSDVYQFIDNSGTPTITISNDSLGSFIDFKLHNDTMFSLTNETYVGIKKYDLNGNFCSLTNIDTNNVSHTFRPHSFIIADSSYFVYGQKQFAINGNFNTSFCIRKIDFNGNILFEHLSNPSVGLDEIKDLKSNSNGVVYLGESNQQNGVTNINLVHLNNIGQALWDTSLTYLSPIRQTSPIVYQNGKYYLGIIAFDSITNLYSSEILEYNENNNSLTKVFELDSLISRDYFKFDPFQNGIIIEGLVLNGVNHNFDFYYLNQNVTTKFESYTDTTQSTSSYFLIEGNSVYFGGSQFIAKLDLTLLSVKSNELNASLFNLFPNPCSDKLTIKINNTNLLKSNFELINSLGKVIISSIFPPETIDLSNIPSGIYFVRLYNVTYSQVKLIAVSH